VAALGVVGVVGGVVGEVAVEERFAEGEQAVGALAGAGPVGDRIEPVRITIAVAGGAGRCRLPGPGLSVVGGPAAVSMAATREANESAS
jgi:hypothetical protein